MSVSLLKVEGAGKRFGGLQALSGVGIDIKEGTIYGLMGPMVLVRQRFLM